MFRKYSIGKRIIALMVLFTLGFVALVFALFFTASNVKNSGIKDAQTIMLEGEKAKIRLGTHTVAQALGEALKGVAERKAQAAIIAAVIDPIRFEDDKSGYYFVYSGTVNIVHPVQKKLEYTDLGNAKDANGVYYVRDLYEAARRGGGFVSFIFGKPVPGGKVVNTPKISYVEMIPGTDLWISTGVYIDNVDRLAEDIESRMNSQLWRTVLIVVSVILAILLCIVLPICVKTVRSIVMPLREATRAAESIAGGNLEVVLSVEGEDEVSSLQRALQAMAANLRESIRDSRDKEREATAQALSAERAANEAKEAVAKADASAAGMASAAEKLDTAVKEMEAAVRTIAANTAGVRDGASTQIGRINEVLSSMEELSSSVHDAARNASAAAQQTELSRLKVSEGADMAGQSGTAMRELKELTDSLTGNMEQLGDQSAGIGRIINVINDIADQTNLLALNAAIEAARAGEAGRGFAVVADEVRKLAEKTMEATREVGTSITSIQQLATVNISGMGNAVNAINSVTSLTENTVTSLREVQNIVQESSAQVQAIAAAVEQQSASSEAVTSLVQDVSRIADENGHLTAEADAQLRGLNAKAGELQELVRQLRSQKA